MQVLDSTCALAATGVGTPYYLSPEICHGLRYSYKSDIWSAGCILYEMTCGKRPFDGVDMRGLMGQIMQGRFRPVPPRYSQDLRALIGSILQPEQARRPTMEQVLSSPALRARAEKFRRSENGEVLTVPALPGPPREPREQPAAPSVAPQQPQNKPVPPAVPILRVDQLDANSAHHRLPLKSLLKSCVATIRRCRSSLACHLRLKQSQKLSVVALSVSASCLLYLLQ